MYDVRLRPNNTTFGRPIVYLILNTQNCVACTPGNVFRCNFDSLQQSNKTRRSSRKIQFFLCHSDTGKPGHFIRHVRPSLPLYPYRSFLAITNTRQSTANTILHKILETGFYPVSKILLSVQSKKRLNSFSFASLNVNYNADKI